MRYFYSLLFTLLIVFGQSNLQAQILTASPANFTLDDEVTITYNATLGNKALESHTGKIYLHTGVISSPGAGWSNVQGSWGQAIPRLEMSELANAQYSFTMVPRQFYGLGPDDEAHTLAFVFRNADGSLAGKMGDGTDIFLSLSEPEVEITNFGSKNYQSHTLKGDVLSIETDNGSVAIQVWADGITRVDLNSPAHSANAESYAVIAENENARVTVTDGGSYLLYDALETDVYIQKSPLQLKFIHRGDTLLSEEVGFYEQDEYVGTRFKLNNTETLHGTGSRAIPYNRRGRELKLYNEAHYGYTKGAPVLNVSIPFLVSSRGYGIFFDNHYGGKLDAGSTDQNIMDWRFRGGPATYYVLAAQDYTQLLGRYSELTGKQPLPPRWALGFIQSKYGYKDEAETRDIVNKLQQDSIPLDALVLDLYWFGVEGDMGRLDWDKQKFPTAEAMVKDLEAKGVNTVLITEPYFTQQSGNFDVLAEQGLLVENEQGEPYLIEDFWAGPAGLIDITKPEAQDWMWQYYKKHIQTGVQGWWSDLGEPENHPADMRHQGGLKPYEVHNIFSLLWMKSLYEGYQREFPAQRVFNLIRSGYAGMQRYASFPWSGDIERSWQGLQAQIPIMVSMSMSGVPYMHSDLGGFTGGGKQPELYTRWLQFGAFGPIMRAHGAGGIPPEPIFYDEPYRSIVRDYIQLRYRLSPYLYSLAYKNSIEGTPLALPMNFFEPSNSKLAVIDDQYFLGESLLIAPVTEMGKTSREVVLPAGHWVDFWTGRVLSGNRTLSVAAPLERLPMMVKGGAILPMISERNSLSTYRTDSLTLQYYLAGNGNSEFTLYDDNGQTNNTAQSEMLKLSANSNAGKLSLSIEKSGESFNGAPAQRYVVWQIRGMQSQPSGVSWAGQSLTAASVPAQLGAGKMYYNAETKTLWVAGNYSSGRAMVEVNYEARPTGQMEIGTLRIIEPSKSSGNYLLGFEAPASGSYTLEVRNDQGRTIFIKAFQDVAAGVHQASWNGADSRLNKLPAGSYTILVTTRNAKESRVLELR
jgi:alpha-glucosidase (family GH31 glycosyl hydrolase)